MRWTLMSAVWLLGERTAAPLAAQPIQHIYRPRTRTTQEKEKEAIGLALMESKGRVSDRLARRHNWAPLLDTGIKNQGAENR